MKVDYNNDLTLCYFYMSSHPFGRTPCQMDATARDFACD
jgi:hypothetical protein